MMRTLKILLQKEFRQIFRNKIILAISLMAPIMQFLVLPLAANYEIKNINLVIVDNDHSAYSRQLLGKISASGYFKLTGHCDHYKEAFRYIERGQADVILDIPQGFERDLLREGNQKVFLAMNAINGTKASLGGSYLGAIIADFDREISGRLNAASAHVRPVGLEIRPTNWFNPKRNYKLSLIPGILALLVTMVGGFLSALNIVKEKEIGTIEQINVSPVKKRDFILAKLIPFWVLANVVFTVGLILSYFVYGIVPQGSILLLYGFVAVYLLAVLGFGLLVSTFCNTQQQAMFLMFFFMMVFVLLGGLFTPIDSMPVWAQWITKLNPVAYLIDVIRMVMLKGSGIKDILPQLGAIILMAVVLNGWAVLNYKKTA
ncbi:MAG TPA: ABC transporter permease [Chitinophagaceae bacterium]|nr:ABC transporter permease [Chitinophagaceae bacterium]